MKISRIARRSLALLAFTAGLTPLAHASLIGTTATLTYNQFAFNSAATFANPRVVGTGTEFSATGIDVFGQHWTLNGDVFANGITFSWTESTRGTGGNISAGPDRFGFDLNIAGTVLPTMALVSSVGAAATSGHVVINATGADSVHFGFDHLYAGESYTFAGAQAVPEPGSAALMLTGLGLLGMAVRRRR